MKRYIVEWICIIIIAGVISYLVFTPVEPPKPETPVEDFNGTVTIEYGDLTYHESIE